MSFSADGVCADVLVLDAGGDEDDGDVGTCNEMSALGTNAHVCSSKPDVRRHERHAQVPAR